eukprot:g72501.t1
MKNKILLCAGNAPEKLSNGEINWADAEPQDFAAQYWKPWSDLTNMHAKQELADADRNWLRSKQSLTRTGPSPTAR